MSEYDIRGQALQAAVTLCANPHNSPTREAEEAVRHYTHMFVRYIRDNEWPALPPPPEPGEGWIVVKEASER